MVLRTFMLSYEDHKRSITKLCLQTLQGLFTMKLQSDTQQRHIMNVQQFILLRGIKTWLVLIQNNSNWNRNILKRKKKYLCKMMTVKTELRTWNENL